MPPEQESGGGYAPPSPLQQRLYVKPKTPMGATAFAPRMLRAKVRLSSASLRLHRCLPATLSASGSELHSHSSHTCTCHALCLQPERVIESCVAVR